MRPLLTLLLMALLPAHRPPPRLGGAGNVKMATGKKIAENRGGFVPVRLTRKS